MTQPDKKLSRLKELMGKTMHRNDGEIYKFVSFQIEDDKITIATDRDWLETSFYDLLVFLDGFQVVETPEVIEEKRTAVALSKKPSVLPSEQLINIRDILLDNIRKVQDDPKYIPQAQSVTNTVNALVNLAKTEMQYRKQND